MLGGYHLKVGVVAAAKTARCGTPVSASIEIERLMMRAEQRLDAMCLWKNLRSLGLVGCDGGPWVGSGERVPEEEMDEGGINDWATSEGDDEIWERQQRREREGRETYRQRRTSQTALSVILCWMAAGEKRGCRMGGGGRDGRLRQLPLPFFLTTWLLIHKIPNKIHKNSQKLFRPINDETRAAMYLLGP